MSMKTIKQIEKVLELLRLFNYNTDYAMLRDKLEELGLQIKTQWIKADNVGYVTEFKNKYRIQISQSWQAGNYRKADCVDIFK